MRIWQFTQTAGGLENHLALKTVPLPIPKPDQHLIQILATALNPVDYKPAEFPVVGRLLVRRPATPGIDISARIITPAAGSMLRPGQLVFGAVSSSPFIAGGLAAYAATNQNLLLPIPNGVDPIDAAGVPVAGLTAYQTIVPYVKKGDRLFLNGGSGGVGVFGIQIAKVIGAHVTVTCSAKNVELCRRLGADEVVDYTAGDVVGQLTALRQEFDHVVDNIGGNHELYFRAHEYSRPGAVFVNVAAAPTLSHFWFVVKAGLLPGFLGGGKRTLTGFFAQAKLDDLQQLIDWMQQGKIKAVIDTKFPYEQAPDAFRKLRTGRARGKIIVEGETAH